MKVRPLHPHAALLLVDSNAVTYLAISDLHIGIESELDAKGVTLQHDSNEIATEILSLAKKERAKGIILLGDLKHRVGTISRQEWNDIPTFLKELSSVAQVYLIPGNHDGNIRHLVPQDVNMAGSRGMVLEDTLLVHGHSLPSEARAGVKRIVMGHLHPVFLRSGSVINGERVWIHLRARKESLFAEKGSIDLVILPSFNRYLYAAGPKSHRRSTSPIVRRLMEDHGGIESCIIARLDGSIVGDATALADVL